MLEHWTEIIMMHNSIAKYKKCKRNVIEWWKNAVFHRFSCVKGWNARCEIKDNRFRASFFFCLNIIHLRVKMFVKCTLFFIPIMEILLQKIISLYSRTMPVSQTMKWHSVQVISILINCSMAMVLFKQLKNCTNVRSSIQPD